MDNGIAKKKDNSAHIILDEPALSLDYFYSHNILPLISFSDNHALHLVETTSELDIQHNDIASTTYYSKYLDFMIIKSIYNGKYTLYPINSRFYVRSVISEDAVFAQVCNPKHAIITQERFYVKIKLDKQREALNYLYKTEFMPYIVYVFHLTDIEVLRHKQIIDERAKMALNSIYGCCSINPPTGHRERIMRMMNENFMKTL